MKDGLDYFIYKQFCVMTSALIISEFSGSCSYGSWIYNYLCNQCLSPLTLWVRTPLRQGLLDTTLCDKVCQLLAAGRWFSPCTTISSTNKTDSQDITEILLKVVLNNHKHKPNLISFSPQILLSVMTVPHNR